MSNYNKTLQSNNTDLQAILNTINTLPEASGGELPKLTNPGTADTLLLNKQLIDGEGKVVEGTIPTKTSSDLTASGATVTVPAGHYATAASKTVATATQVTPSIEVNSAGLITATATQTAGYVSAGTKSATKQLITQAAVTITPTKSAQTAVAKDVYTTGAVTVAAIPDEYIATSDATAEASEIMIGETAYVNGSKVTGTFTIDNELTVSNELVASLQNAINDLPEVMVKLQSKTVTPTAKEQLIVTDSGYDGLIKVIVEGDENLVPENIVNGVSIFGVEGSASASGGDGEYYMNLYNSDTDGNFEFIINGVYCPSGETTMIPTQVSLGSFILTNYNQLAVEGIYYTYEYEGDDGEIITEEYSPMSLTDEEWLVYGVIELSSGIDAVLHIVYSE